MTPGNILKARIPEGKASHVPEEECSQSSVFHQVSIESHQPTLILPASGQAGPGHPRPHQRDGLEVE